MTETNHKVSVPAKRFSHAIAAAFAAKCAYLEMEDTECQRQEAVMQDASGTSWALEAHVSPEMLESLRELNYRFLDLIGAQPVGWNSPNAMLLPVELARQVQPLSSAQKKAAANCPYALFDLRFQDDPHWQARLLAGRSWNVAEPHSADQNMVAFVRVALFFTWHVASAGRLAARLLLGMNDATAAAFRAATIDRVPSLVHAEADNLTARWSDCPRFWSALSDAAARPNANALRRVQLYGLQLTAAARLS